MESNAYGIGEKEEELAFPLNLNQELAKREKEGEKIVGPGLPSKIVLPKVSGVVTP